MAYAAAAGLLWVGSFLLQYPLSGAVTATLGSLPAGGLLLSLVLLVCGQHYEDSRIQKFICLAASVFCGKQLLFTLAQICLAHDLAARAGWSAGRLEAFRYSAALVMVIAGVELWAFIRISKISANGNTLRSSH